MSRSLTKKEEFEQLPRPYKQRQYTDADILQEATALKELPSVLIPSSNRKISLPPLVHYGYALPIERLDELVERKLGLPPGALDTDPFTIQSHLRREVFGYGVTFHAVYLDGTDSMLFLAISSNWKPSRAKLDEVIERLKEFLEVDEDPVWCLDTDNYYWQK